MSAQREKLLVVIPARDEQEHVGRVVSPLRDMGYAVCVVDDGSSDATASTAARAGAYVIRHEECLGVSSAVDAGVGYAQENGFTAIVTMDGDGQHDPAAVPGFEDALAAHDAVMGCRFDRLLGGVPTPKLASNSLGARIASGFVGQLVRDAACGMRAFHVDGYPGFDEGLPGYSFPFLVLYNCYLRGLDVGWRHIEPRYAPGELAYTRSSEMLALYASTLRFFPAFADFFESVSRLIAARKDHVVSLGVDRYYCFALPDREGYIVQCDERLMRFDFQPDLRAVDSMAVEELGTW